MKSEKELLRFWKEYIDIPIYRVVSGWHYKDVLKKGINPKKDPYEKLKPDLFKFYKLIVKLDKAGKYKMLFDFGTKKSLGSYWAKVSISDLKKPVVDFTPKEKDLEYYKNLKGGALIRNVDRLSSKFLEDKPNLTKEQWNLINKLNKWAKSKEIENEIIQIKSSEKCFENAFFQLTNLTKTKTRRHHKEIYYPSPFGSFEHFKKVIKKEGFKKYVYRIKNKKYYLRVKDYISPNIIKPLKGGSHSKR